MTTREDQQGGESAEVFVCDGCGDSMPAQQRIRNWPALCLKCHDKERAQWEGSES